MSLIKPYIEMQGVNYKRDELLLLDNISFTVAPGEFLVIAGSDVVGKTPFLKLCAGLISPASGEVKIGGKNISGFNYNELQKFRQKTGFVFQDAVLISNLNIRENIALPLKYHYGVSDKTIDKRVEKYLESFNLVRYANERPAGLPLEIRLLVNLARALIVDPDLLLLDEIFASLGKTAVNMVSNRLKELKKDGNLTCLMTANTVRLKSNVPEESFSDSLMLIEGGSIIEKGDFNNIREKLIAD
jgi:ABC-type transporter Mla maintaining outer membrane lipid asymmetry ATPase subunit MlaF